MTTSRRKVETRRRGWFGWVVLVVVAPILFLFNTFMVSFFYDQLSGKQPGDLQLLVWAFFWMAGDLVLSLPLILTRGRKTLESSLPKTVPQKEEPKMFKMLVSALAVAVLPAPAFAQELEIGPGGVEINPGDHERHLEHRSGWGRDFVELRQACLHKHELGEEGQGNCERYRRECGR